VTSQWPAGICPALLEKFPYFYGKILAAKFPDSFFFARKFTEN